MILVQDRSRLGGNSSSEVKMHIVGANNHTGRPGWREGGIIEELRLDDAVNNPHRSWEMWDLLLYDKLVSEPNITLLLDTAVYRATKDQKGEITSVLARSDKTEHIYRINSKLYADCTGDARLAVECGATIRWGHEARDEFDEPLGWEKPTRDTLGSSIHFNARDYGKPIGYTPPKWARQIEKKQLQFRPVGSWGYGYWWIEWGGRSTRFATTNGFASSCSRSSPACGTTSRTAARSKGPRTGRWTGSAWSPANERAAASKAITF